MLISEGRVLEDNELMPVRSGMCLNVRVEPAPDSTPPEDPTRHLHFEDLSLMQFSSYSSHADAPAQPANACPLNPYAQIFQPERPNLWLYPEYIQTLHAEFAQHAFAWEYEMASTQVLVWFVDHRFHFPTCRFPRPVTLYEDFSDWEHRIKQAWNDSCKMTLQLKLLWFHQLPQGLPHM